MRNPADSNKQLIALAEEAADRLFDEDGDASDPVFEPQGYTEACAAVRRLGHRFNQLPGAIANALESARKSGAAISSDQLQGLAEIVQNADDAQASEVRLLLRPADLLVSHNGSPVRLGDVLGLATPWLSTKGDESATIGRFGIGLTTLSSLSETLEVHCAPYHVRLGAPILSPIDPPTPSAGFDEPGWTTFRIPFREGVIERLTLDVWLENWGDSALLFLSNVCSITWLNPDGGAIRKLAITRQQKTKLLKGPFSERPVTRLCVDSDGGERWMVYKEFVPTPSGIVRSRKATASTTPIAIAIPLKSVDHGQIHAGLPVARTGLPLFANAQFDPLTNRQGFSDNEWNAALVPLVADLWSRAALDLFCNDPRTAWRTIPISSPVHEHQASELVRTLEEAVVATARGWLASRVSFRVRGAGTLSLAQLAVEAKPLERMLTLAETAKLAGLPATLPFVVRDVAGRWRDVLDDWRTAGAELPEPVSVERALDLLDGNIRPVGSTIKLVAAALGEKLEARLLELPCIVADDGRHLVPPRRDSPNAVATDVWPLAKQLGLVTQLHDAHSGRGQAARTVLKWLRKCGALLQGKDDRDLVRRLDAAGKSGQYVPKPLTEEKVRLLREAFELFSRSDQQDLGPGVGQAVLLEAYEFKVKGGRKRPKIIAARAADSYLPKSVDREADSFAAAADKSIGITWLSDRYARALRSSKGRTGVGAQRFLRLLGAESAPRPIPHPELVQRFVNEKLGLSGLIADGPLARRQAMQTLGATYTLQDYGCPALSAVLEDLCRVRRGKTRRVRAGALLATLSRAWERLENLTEVECADDYYSWQRKGRVPAYWIWQARDIAWLDDESGNPRRPSELHVRTSGTEAIYGADSADYLHQDLSHPSRHGVLTALGVSSNPNRSELVARLSELRDLERAGEFSLAEVGQETAVIYKALAESLSTAGSDSDLNPNQLRSKFERGEGLIFTNRGWHPPRNVLAGSRIFGDYKAFAPPVGADRLWSALKLRKPTTRDYIQVIRKIARRNSPPEGNREGVLLETLRELANQLTATEDEKERRALRKLPLWTSKGWKRDRPVYATDDPSVAEGLREVLPIWKPGGGLAQFLPLLGLLGVEQIRPKDAEVIEPDIAYEDLNSTELFRAGVLHLQEDLARNAPDVAESLGISWDHLTKFGVRIHPTLALRVRVVWKGTSTAHDCEVAAHADTDRQVLFVRDRRRDLLGEEAGGRALAMLFNGDPRRLARDWLAACHRAEAGREANPFELSRHRDERERAKIDSEIKTRILEFQKRTEVKHRNSKRSNKPTTGSYTPPHADNSRHEPGDASNDLGIPRVLVNPRTLGVANPGGRITSGGK